MSGQHPPVTCKQFKSVLKNLGFKGQPGKGSHENWLGTYAGRRRKVTVDCPKAPFTGTLLRYMLEQLGADRDEFFRLAAAV